MAAVAIGRHGDPEQLSPEMRKTEALNGRKPLSAVAHSGPLRG